MPELKQVIANIPPNKQLMYHFTSGDPREADLLAAALADAGRDPVAAGDAFYGDAAPVEAMRKRYPDVWAFTPEEGQKCAGDYILTGWSSVLPASCRGGTMVIPLNRQFLYWGWPNRLIARMTEHGGKVIVGGPADSGRPDAGLTVPEQLGEIPSSFNGYVWVEDSWNIPPALNPGLDRRTIEQREAAAAAVTRRLEAQ